MIYIVKVNFAGFIGCDEVYEVYADSEAEALEEARRVAEDELSIDIIGKEEE